MHNCEYMIIYLIYLLEVLDKYESEPVFEGIICDPMSDKLVRHNIG